MASSSVSKQNAPSPAIPLAVKVAVPSVPSPATPPASKIPVQNAPSPTMPAAAGVAVQREEKPSISLAARVAVEREDMPAGPSAMDLARMAAEEDWKRRLAGGGGGGSPAMKSPTQFVLYSMSIINQKMMELYQSVMAAFAANQAKGNEQQTQAPGQAPVAMPKEAQVFMQNTVNGVRILNEAMQRNMRELGDLGKQVSKLASNIANFATLSMAALVNRMIKLLGFNRSEDEVFEAEENYEKNAYITEDELPDLTARLFNQNDERNGRSIISHIQNVADQMNRQLTLLKKRYNLGKKTKRE